MRRRPRRTMVRDPAPSLAPLADIVMVILIFMMLGSSFVGRESGFDVQSPRSGAAAGGSEAAMVPPIRVELREAATSDECRIHVLGQPLSDSTFGGLQRFLASRLAAGADPGSRILISADPSIRYQLVVSALDACVRAGFSKLQFSVAAGSALGTTPASSP